MICAQSASGTGIDDVTARGRFAGSRLELTAFAGNHQWRRTVTGSVSTLPISRQPRLDDIRAAVNRAPRLLEMPMASCDYYRPLRIVSTAQSGTIARRVEVNRAS
jgi:translocation and assembly module TamB